MMDNVRYLLGATLVAMFFPFLEILYQIYLKSLKCLPCWIVSFGNSCCLSSVLRLVNNPALEAVRIVWMKYTSSVGHILCFMTTGNK